MQQRYIAEADLMHLNGLVVGWSSDNREVFESIVKVLESLCRANEELEVKCEKLEMALITKIPPWAL